MELQKIKQFFYDRLLEASSYFGIFPEIEGGILPQNLKNLRLRVSFHDLKLKPVSDSGSLWKGNVSAEVLFEPGEIDSAEFLLDRIITLFSPGQGEFLFGGARFLIGSASFSNQKSEGKYQRTGVVLDFSVWDVYGS